MVKGSQILMRQGLAVESRNPVAATLAKPSTCRRFPALAGILSLAMIVTWSIGSADASPLVPQTHLNGNCIPRFAVPLPVFGPAGSIPRVDALAHRDLTVTMKEVDQAVLPQGGTDTCGKGIRFAKTRVWAYEISDTTTKKILGPANWPAVTIEARRNVATEVEYVNQLPSFNPSDPYGAGLVQGLVAVDQTIHWADPLGLGCGMMSIDCSQPGSLAATDSSLAPPGPRTICGRPFRAGQIRPMRYAVADPGSPCCQQYTGPVPATVHLHGAEGSASSDGGPDSWFTPDGRTGSDYTTLGSPGPGRAIYLYQNAQEPGTLWFHDHTLGATRTGVFSGLAGFYLLRDPTTEPPNLPAGPYEIEMAIQDRSFDTKSRLYFPDQVPTKAHPFWSPMFDGDVATVNGAPWPYFNVEPRRYRFHLLNGSNHRFYDLAFGKAKVYAVGADDNYLDRPARVRKVSLSPGERAEIIVDFTKMAGRIITVTNDARSETGPFPLIMQLRVVLPLKGRDNSCGPDNLEACARPIPLVRLTDGHGHVMPGVKIDKVRQLVLNDEFNFPNDIEEYLNNTKWDGRLSPSIAAEFPTDRVSELPRVGSTELWEIINIFEPPNGVVTHPIHTHLVKFQILNRQKINMNEKTGYLAAWEAAFGTGPVPLPSSCTPHQLCAGYGPPLSYKTPNADGAVGGNPALGPYLEGSPIAPNPGESGWKDTAQAVGGEVLRILIRWTPSDVPVVPNLSYAGHNFFPFDPTEGSYVWHCHIIDHEDNEMMRPYKVTN